MLIVTTIANPPELKLGQELLHGDLQSLHSVQDGMQKLTAQME
jgi:hypothetical protein